MVEHAAVNRRVVGSSPTSGANSLLAHKNRAFSSGSQRPEQTKRAFGPGFGPALDREGVQKHRQHKKNTVPKFRLPHQTLLRSQWRDGHARALIEDRAQRLRAQVQEGRTHTRSLHEGAGGRRD